jgi:alanine racemase
MTHDAWLEIDVAALAHNARVLRRAIPSGTRLGILVKANGYGHGLELAAEGAMAGGADQLIVANLDEGLSLRRAQPDVPILVAYPIPVDGVGAAARARLELTVSGMESSRRLLAALDGQPVRLHLEIDSGMGRGGVAPADVVAVVAAIDAAPGAELAGVWSHLADGTDLARSRDQIAHYEAALAAIEATGRGVPLRHVAATEGVFVGTSPAFELVRVGIGFYGTLGLDVAAAPAVADLAAELRPAMSVKAQPVRLEAVSAGTSIGYGSEWTTARPSRIATLPIGYADGWPRSTWPGAEALVRGRRVPLVGRVSMDSVCVDVTDVPDVGVDDTFVLLGGDLDERITVDDLARHRHTIPNEVFCAFGPRLERRRIG